MKGQGYIGVLIIILVIAAIFFLTGGNFQQFVQPSEAGIVSGRGLTITLSYDTIIKPKETFNLKVEITNRGEFDVKDCEVSLLGFSSDWTLNGKSFTGASKHIDIIKKDDTETIRWKLKAPTYELSYPFIVKVVYPYETEYKGLFKVVSESYAEEKEDEGAIIDEKTSVGPLSVSIKPEDNFILDDTEIPIEVTITNIGGGDIDGLIQLTGTPSIYCYTGFVEIDPTTNSAKVDCELIPGKVSEFKNLFASLNLTYTYQIEAEGMVEVSSE